MRLAAMAGLLAGLAPAMAHAENNIDQGKTAAQIWAVDCAVCHKSVRGLVSGKNRYTLTEFLREHYTTSRDQAAALAAYVLAGGGEGSAASTQARGPRPAAERARAATEEPKPANEPAKPEEEGPATVKLQQPADQDAKPEAEPILVEEPRSVAPGPPPAAGRNERRPATMTATRSHRAQPETSPPAHEPAALPMESGSGEAPNVEGGPASSAAAPALAEPGEATIVPRDNIPD